MVRNYAVLIYGREAKCINKVCYFSVMIEHISYLLYELTSKTI